ncbi:MAG: hypothetical protein IK102_10330 [Treponema sp.]|nr:hypothetical protein [Treponema sp.]
MTAKNRKITFTFIVSILLFLVSCENYMTRELAEELKRQIEYANAPKATISIRVDSSEYGDVYPSSVTVVQGETFTVEFTQKKGCLFNYWLFSNPQTGELLGEDVLAIKEEKTGENLVEGTTIRRITVVVKALAENMEIRPKCYFESERVAPELKSISVAKTEKDAKERKNLISFDNFTHYAAKANYGDDSTKVAANIENHHVNSLWINFEGYDANSGVGYLQVKETLLRDNSGDVVSTAVTYTTDLKVGDAVNGPSVSKTLNHAFKTPKDGVVHVEFLLKDKAGNFSAKKEMDVIKDTVCTISCTLSSDDSENRVADNNNLYSLNVKCVMNYNNGLPYAKDMDGNVYKDKDGLVFTSADSPDFTGYPTRLVKMEYGYEGEAFKEYSKSELNFYLKKDSDNDYRPAANFTVKANDLKDTTLRAVATDSIGNLDVQEIVIYKACWPTFVSTNSYYKTFQFYFNQNLGEVYPYIEYIDTADVKQTVTLSSCQNGGDFTINELFTDESDLKDGTYYCYLLKNASTTSIKSRGVKPYIIYQNVEPEVVTPLANCEIPILNCTPLPMEHNTGKRTVRVTVKQPFTPVKDIQYLVLCMKTTTYPNFSMSIISYTPITDFNGSTDIEVDTSEDTYNFFPVLKNQKGDLRSPDGSQSDIYVKSFTLNEDNFPPALTSTASPKYNTIVFPNMRHIYIPPTAGSFDASGLKQDKEGYMTVKYTSSDDSNLLDTGIDWNDKDMIKEYRQKVSNNELYLPFDGSDYGRYCYVLLEDINGNTGVITIDIPNLQYKNITNANVKYQQGYYKIGFTCSVNTNPYATCFYIKNGEWTPIDVHKSYCDRTTWSNYTITRSGDKFNYNIPSLTSEECCSFVKTYIWISYIPDVPGPSPYNYYYDTIYFYPEYCRYPSDYNCNQKNYYYGEAGIEIISSSPCMAETLYCSTNLGTEAKEWVNKAIVAGVDQGTSSFTYKEPLDKIPSGKYYTTIIHFVDGSMLMLPVKVKDL